VKKQQLLFYSVVLVILLIEPNTHLHPRDWRNLTALTAIAFWCDLASDLTGAWKGCDPSWVGALGVRRALCLGWKITRKVPPPRTFWSRRLRPPIALPAASSNGLLFIKAVAPPPKKSSRA
jgi:hypothetical protein